jgi:hypothetical protein
VSYSPTLEVASVSELSVLDLPALGFPTRPMRGSRGIFECDSMGLYEEKYEKGARCQNQVPWFAIEDSVMRLVRQHSVEMSAPP